MDTNKKIKKLQQFADEPSLAIYEELNQLNDELEALNVSELKKGDKGDPGEKPSADELLSIIKPLIPKVKDGEPGKTPTKQELVSLIKPLIPKVSNGVDGIDGEKGDPGENGSPDTGLQIKEKLLALSEYDRLKLKDFGGFDELVANLERVGNRPLPIPQSGITTTFFSLNDAVIGRAKNVNFTSGSTLNVTLSGDTATITIPSGGGGSGPTLQTNGVNNGDQTLLNLIDGTGISITDNGSGGITITNTGGSLSGTPTEVLYYDATTGLVTSDSNFTRDNSNNGNTHIRAFSAGAYLADFVADNTGMGGFFVDITGGADTASWKAGPSGLIAQAADASLNLVANVVLTSLFGGLSYTDVAGQKSSSFDVNATTTSLIYRNLATSVSTGVDAIDNVVTVGATSGGNGTTAVIDDTAQTYTLNKLSGSGTEMVIADPSGVLGRQTIPSNGLPPFFPLASPYGSANFLTDQREIDIGFTGGSGATQVFLPTTAMTVGDLVIVTDSGAAASSNNITVDAGTGNTIIGSTYAQTIVMANDGEVLWFRLIDDNSGVYTWKSL